MSGEFTFDTRKFERALKEIPKALNKEVGVAFNTSGVEFTAAMESRFSPPSGPPFWANPSDDGIVSRSGDLARSVGHEVGDGPTVNDRSLTLFIGDALRGKYASLQEYGGTVNGSPWLTIPLPDNKTDSGVDKFDSAAKLRNDPTVKTWIQRSKAGNLIIRAKFEGKDEIQNLWILKRSVTVKPRLGFFKTAEAMRNSQIKNLNRAVIRALKTLESS
ncbi:MAG: hypothetical protein JKY61_12370 [Planctomycetes bacterium]|nr:hypothetical protein [Planctomycetota bacterium]